MCMLRNEPKGFFMVTTKTVKDEVATARSALASKVIEVVEAEHLESYVPDEADFAARERGRHEEDIAYDLAIEHVITALRDLFRSERVEVE
jgi:hypothetical protein